MEKDPQKVSAVLADPTRYAIYQYVMAAKHPVPVAEAAKQFGLHANVARMHLAKLTDIGLLSAEAEKTGKGGRPGYVYTPSGYTVSLTVPAREFQLLANLLVQSLMLTGAGGREAISQIGRTFGLRLGMEALQAAGPQASSSTGPEDLYQICAEALHRLGVSTYVHQHPDGSAQLAMRNCGFREVATAYPEHVCSLCHAMVEGVTAVCLEAAPEVKRAASVPEGDRECVYEVNGLIRLE